MQRTWFCCAACILSTRPCRLSLSFLRMNCASRASSCGCRESGETGDGRCAAGESTAFCLDSHFLFLESPLYLVVEARAVRKGAAAGHGGGGGGRIDAEAEAARGGAEGEAERHTRAFGCLLSEGWVRVYMCVFTRGVKNEEYPAHVRV